MQYWVSIISLLMSLSFRASSYPIVPTLHCAMSPFLPTPSSLSFPLLPPRFDLLLSPSLNLPLSHTSPPLSFSKVVVINKIDIPEVREKLEELTKGIKAAAGHSRVLGISAATGER
jgi:hypothetical protein